MLFISPDHLYKWIGRELVEFAIEQYGVRYVNVNEQNIGVLIFYRRIGFEMFERIELDEQSNPFSILIMKLLKDKKTV